MTMFVAWRRRRGAWSGLFVIAAMALGQPALATEPVRGDRMATAGEPIVAHIDEAKIVKLPEKTTTVVVGNPLIADVSVQPGGILVVTAKSNGVTNVVALNREGATLMEHPIQVMGVAENVVVLYRGVERESYSCTPYCHRRVTVGDSVPYFTSNLNQVVNLSGQAQAQAAQQPK